MICKEDVILWFKELESYKRIDMMCTLLNMCLPFELRFLGTCLEELGRRDSQELRGIELRVNNAQDLATDMLACQKGEPTDMKIRRKMALYLALIRVCNRNCVAEIFRTLEGWGDRDFSNINDLDTLQELLLVYTMAANHPVFSFAQHMKCSEIFERIKKNNLVCDQPASSAQMEQTLTDLRQHMPPPPTAPSHHQELLQQQALHAMHAQLLTTSPMQVLPQGSMPITHFPQPAHLPKLIQAEGSAMQHSITVDGITHMLTPNMPIPGADSSAILAHPNAAWALRTYPPQQPPNMENAPPPQSSSPMLSQQSSPSSSRTTSPNRTMQQQQQPMRNMPKFVSMKNIRRPSAETTPPPSTQQQQQQQQQQLPHEQMSSEIILPPQNLKHLNEVILNNEGSGTQLQTLIRNGFTRAGHHARLKTGTYIHPHQQQQQQQQQSNQHFAATNYAMNAAGLTYNMQNMSMSDSGMSMHSSLEGGMNSNKSAAGSDSSSSIGSSGEISPPETPTLGNASNSGVGSFRLTNDAQQQQQQQQKSHHHQQQQQQQLSYNKTSNLSARLNGRTADKTASGSVSNVGTATTLVYAAPTATALNNSHAAQQQQQQQMFGTADIILAPGGNAGAANLLQNSMANNNNGGGVNASNTAGSSGGSGNGNNNINTNALLLSSAATASGNVLLHSHQQQYNAAANYAYHAAPSNHLSNTARPPITLTHNPALAPPPHGTFRVPSFQLPPPNGELIYASYHTPGLAFLSGAAPPVAPTVALRNAANVTTSVATAAQQPSPATAPTTQQQQQQPIVPATVVPSAALLATPHYGALTVGVGVKPLSCYNCGSQTHSGRDCQEVSMEDVTRNANYKLNYSVTATSATSPTTSSVVGGAAATTGAGVSATASDAALSNSHTQKHNALENSGSNSSSSGNGGSAVTTPTTATVAVATTAAVAK